MIVPILGIIKLRRLAGGDAHRLCRKPHPVRHDDRKHCRERGPV